ncbi:hypothetical protein FHT26_005907 [Rhizobacter sp. SG703]|nr:hypothetical protein [Rhizobacter sp. SG703]
MTRSTPPEGVLSRTNLPTNFFRQFCHGISM